jgi:hypothetical protein
MLMIATGGRSLNQKSQIKNQKLLLLLMATVARLPGCVLGAGLFVAIPTVCVKGNLELLHVPFALLGVMASAALLDLVTFLPHVLAILVNVVTFIARYAVIFCMGLVIEGNRPFPVRLVTFIVDDDFFGHFTAGESENREEKESGKDNQGNPVPLLWHRQASLDKILNPTSFFFKIAYHFPQRMSPLNQFFLPLCRPQPCIATLTPRFILCARTTVSLPISSGYVLIFRI